MEHFSLQTREGEEKTPTSPNTERRSKRGKTQRSNAQRMNHFLRAELTLETSVSLTPMRRSLSSGQAELNVTLSNFYWVFCPFFCTPYMYIISVERFLFSYVFWLVFSVFCFKIFATKGAPWEDFTVVLKNHISTETSAWMNLYIFFQQ